MHVCVVTWMLLNMPQAVIWPDFNSTLVFFSFYVWFSKIGFMFLAINNSQSEMKIEPDQIHRLTVKKSNLPFLWNLDLSSHCFVCLHVVQIFFCFYHFWQCMLLAIITKHSISAGTVSFQEFENNCCCNNTGVLIEATYCHVSILSLTASWRQRNPKTSLCL